MRNLFLALTFIVLLTSTGCSSFHRDWRVASKAPVAPDSVEGRWEGSWESNANGHSGRLRCILVQLSKDEYEAKFHAKYKKIFGFGYVAQFRGSTSDNIFHFAGDADLGKLAGGVYRYEGKVSPTNFFSTYKSKYDHGTFQMTRPE